MLKKSVPPKNIGHYIIRVGTLVYLVGHMTFVRYIHSKVALLYFDTMPKY